MVAVGVEPIPGVVGRYQETLKFRPMGTVCVCLWTVVGCRRTWVEPSAAGREQGTKELSWFWTNHGTLRG